MRANKRKRGNEHLDVSQAAKADGGGAAEAGAVLRLSREFQNSHVERSPWRAVVFNQDMEYAAGATEDHRFYFWSLVGANLATILEFEGAQPHHLLYGPPVSTLKGSCKPI